MICPVCGHDAKSFTYFHGQQQRHHTVLQCMNDLCGFEMHMSGANKELSVENMSLIYDALLLGYEKEKDIP